MANHVAHLKQKTQHLAQRVADNRQKRAQALAQSKWFAERVRMIREAPRRTATEFWCATCDRDFSCVDALKMVGSNRDIPYAYYEGMCPMKHLAKRHITDKHLDPYYHLSAMVKQQRYDMRDDLLTPADPRFRIVYPKQWAQLEEERETREMMEEEDNKKLYG